MEPRQISAPCVFQSLGRRKMAGCQLGAIPDGTEQDFRKLLPAFDQIACLGQDNQVTLLPLEINDSMLPGIGRWHVHGAGLEQVSLLDLIAFCIWRTKGIAESSFFSRRGIVRTFRISQRDRLATTQEVQANLDFPGRTWRRRFETGIPIKDLGAVPGLRAFVGLPWLVKSVSVSDFAMVRPLYYECRRSVIFSQSRATNWSDPLPPSGSSHWAGGPAARCDSPAVSVKRASPVVQGKCPAMPWSAEFYPVPAVIPRSSCW